MEYFAFGETFVEEHKNSINSPFKFNGKEFDEESGLYYYGARYYDPRLSIWASVDPLMEMFPSMSPYNYCLLNPVKYIDPTGLGPGDPKLHTVEKNETLESIGKKYGINISDLRSMNNLDPKNDKSLQIGTILKINPEADFSDNPVGKFYSNPDNSNGVETNVSHIAKVGLQFATSYGEENQVIVGGNALKSIQKWKEVQKLVDRLMSRIDKDGIATPGEMYSDIFKAGSLWKNVKQGGQEAIEAISKIESPWQNNSQNSPIHVIGSFTLSLRVNSDGKTVTACVYDSKTFKSLSDNKADGTSNRPRKGSNFTPLTNTYQRYIWNIKLKK